MAKKGVGTGVIILLAVAALGSCNPEGDDKAENARSIPTETDVTEKADLPSAEVLVTLPPEIDVQALTIDPDSLSLSLGEKKSLQAVITPEDATDKEVIWTSSNEAVVTVDKYGEISAVSAGTADIIATTGNGISSSVSVSVEGGQRTVTLRYGYSRLDNNNIGKEWSYQYKINGEPAKKGDFVLKIGDVLTLSAEFTESDTKPDIGKASVTHTVTESDIINGFSEEMGLIVTENGGKNSGKSAQFLVEFEFTIE